MRGVARVLHAPPLAGIPYIDNPQDIADRRRRKFVSTTIIIIVVALALTGWHILVMPLDEQWVLIRDWALGVENSSN
jgi:hypothetical protein